MFFSPKQHAYILRPGTGFSASSKFPLAGVGLNNTCGFQGGILEQILLGFQFQVNLFWQKIDPKCEKIENGKLCFSSHAKPKGPFFCVCRTCFRLRVDMQCAGCNKCASTCGFSLNGGRVALGPGQQAQLWSTQDFNYSPSFFTFVGGKGLCAPT